MITAILTRQYENNQTLGRIMFYEKNKITFMCDTIELKWLDNQPQISCIPEGMYKCVYRESKKYPKHYHVTNVPNRTFILIHQANYAGSRNPSTSKSDLLGCIGVGNGYADINKDGIVDLLRSRATLNNMLNYLNKRTFMLTIR